MAKTTKVTKGKARKRRNTISSRAKARRARWLTPARKKQLRAAAVTGIRQVARASEKAARKVGSLLEEWTRPTGRGSAKVRIPRQGYGPRPAAYQAVGYNHKGVPVATSSHNKQETAMKAATKRLNSVEVAKVKVFAFGVSGGRRCVKTLSTRGA